MGPLLKYNTTY